MLKVCWGAGPNLKELVSQLLALCKRRGQLKQPIMDMVQLCMGYLPQLNEKVDKEELILTLKAVTDGKIYAEVERARITLALAMMREAEGKVGEASEILQECAVETFGSMEKKEKTELLLEQVRPSTELPSSHLGTGYRSFPPHFPPLATPLLFRFD